jgi:Fic family protein
VKEFGGFRSGDVGVFDRDVAVHVGARPQFVPQLMADLFSWAESSELHPVLKSAILHYEIETIHPFSDGNGRMGRLWHTLLPVKWNEIFAWIPMESVLYQNRPQYYQAIQDSRKADDSGAFIESTLSALDDVIKHQVEHQDKHQVDLTEIQFAVLKSLADKALSRKEIFTEIGLSGDSRAFRRHIEPILAEGYIEMTVPDKPNSKLQKYRLTVRGENTIKPD